MNHDPDAAVHDLLLSHAATLTPHIQYGELPEEVKDALIAAQRTIRRVAEMPVCYKVRASELEPKAPKPERLAMTADDMRAVVKALNAEAKSWRKVEKTAGPSMKLHAGDMARDFEVRAKVLERKIPPRPWGRYALVGLLGYVVGGLSALGATMWWAP